MGRPSGRCNYAWRYRFSGTKDFAMHSLCIDSPGGQARGQVMQKRSRTAQVKVCVTRHYQLLEHIHVKMAGSIEVGAELVLRARLAVANVTPAML
jgi:hypothetical protein